MAAIEHILTAMQKSGAGSRAAWRVDDPGAPRDAVWAALPPMSAEPGHLDANRIVTARRSDPASGAFDMMRTRVLHHLQQNGWTSVAITSPTAGGGKSVVALNLAFSLANREDCRTALLDLDLRRPGIAAILGISDPPPLESYLRGQAGLEQAFGRLRANLAVACNGSPVRLAAELLQGPETARAFQEMKRKLLPDVVVCDLPPMMASDDMVAFLPNVDCAILVVEAEVNTADEVDACERELAAQTNVLGVVLNKCRHGADMAPHRNRS